MFTLVVKLVANLWRSFQRFVCLDSQICSIKVDGLTWWFNSYKYKEISGGSMDKDPLYQ